MKFPLTILLTFLLVNGYSQSEVDPSYGSNPRAGKLITINGINLYYEIYGNGEPLLLIHGNGGSIKSMRYQIEAFKSKYKVIVADSRGQGKSEMGVGHLTYTQMADDLALLLEKIKIDSALVVGWSDGGILGLLLAIHHPEKIKKLAIMGANLQPDTSAVYPSAIEEVIEWDSKIDKKLRSKDSSKDWNTLKKLNQLLLKQPNIQISELMEIKCPVLVMAGDRDFIREEHTLKIFQHIPNSHLCIFPGQTHFVPVTDPDLFNQLVRRFLETPFTMPTSKFSGE